MLGQLLFHIKILPTILTRQLLGAGGSAVLLGREQGLEPLSALPRTLDLEDPMIPEKQHVINCVCVAYFQIIGVGTHHLLQWSSLCFFKQSFLENLSPQSLFDHLGPCLDQSGPFWTISDKNDFFTPNGQNRVLQSTAVRRHCTDWYEI